ncbi:uncharacterized protein LOC123679336 [Harmonia axyridis]|uniref:uncharacterized protein LOC123679336 n=1 Tax=Harmonia axyridis TaxID=115357 RepID=UPI001E278D53|nr:uncharacterized protein LOC123679336 [Harmonia axyridis]XP_045472848.1 uncharacterized protein LOC123679336 [Harmonia axyridis]
MASEPIVVQAIFSFKGTNNDELCFKKGDIITVTQKDEGWWEGTLNGQTGWFPSNYVECTDAPKPKPHNNQYKSVVLRDLIDSEKAHVTELEGLVTNFLQPLEKSSLLSGDEYKQLTSNINEVLETHQMLLNLLEKEESKPGNDQKVGKLFLNFAPKIKNVHQTYCSLHPRAVCILDKYKEELTKYMESKGATSPGVLVLTTMLSKPFRRLEKYAGMLQELERHIEEFHSDRGDTQRSVAIFKDIASTCAATRRQKELELQVLTGPIRNWEGPSLLSFGEIIYMGSVAVGPQHNDKYFVLFPSCLLILSVSHRLSAFIYEGKLPLSGLSVTRLPDSDQYKNAFEISTSMTEKKIAVCQSKDEANYWVDLLKKQLPKNSATSDLNQKASPSQAHFVPQPPPHLNLRGYCNRSSVVNFRPKIDYQLILPPEEYPSAAPFASLTRYFRKLVKEKLINRNLLKKLLYPEYLNKFNLNLVKIRHHRTECVIFTKDVHFRDSIINCDSDNNSSSESDNIRSKRNRRVKKSLTKSSSEDDSSDGSSSNPFGYIRYYNPQTGSTANSETRYESFVDYGEPATEPKMVEETDKKQSIVLTSVAKIRLNKQDSENSDASSMYTSKGTAFHDLTNLKASLEIANDFKAPPVYFPSTRQSCPTKMVGNKFNQCSLTYLPIPSYSNSDNNLTYPGNNNNDERISEASSTTTHSSSLELPVNTIPLPDPMVAELLYNFDPDDIPVEKRNSLRRSQSNHNISVTKTLVAPPSMFQNEMELEPRETATSLSLPMKNIGFKTHSINSDKPKRRSSVQINPTSSNYESKEKVRRCISTQFLQMSNKFRTSKTSSTGPGSLCEFCIDNLHSPRSSDSGMARSFTMLSPDLSNDLPTCSKDGLCSSEMHNLFQKYSDFSMLNSDSRNAMSPTEFDASDFELQCPCMSPFGSTPRTSCQTSISENIATGSHDSLRKSVTTSINLCTDGSPSRIHSNSVQVYPGSNRESCSSKRDSMSVKSRSTGNLLDPEAELANVELSEDGTPMLYSSGLYAHWWLKAKIPAEVVKGIYMDTRSPTTDVSTSSSIKHLNSPNRKNKQ